MNGSDLFSNLVERATGSFATSAQPLLSARPVLAPPSVGFSIEEVELPVARSTVDAAKPSVRFAVNTQPTVAASATAGRVPAHMPVPEAPSTSQYRFTPTSDPAKAPPSERHTVELRTILEKAVEVAPHVVSPLVIRPDSAPTISSDRVARSVSPAASIAEARPAIARRGQYAPRQQPTQPANTQSAPSVTIRIGKIEVKAPATPSPRPAVTQSAVSRVAPRPSISLQDYLARRNGG